MASNGDTKYVIEIDNKKVVGIGSFHKTLPHNDYGEVRKYAFKKFVKATEGKAEFGDVPAGEFKSPATGTATFVNPQAGLAKDRLTAKPSSYEIPPAPKVVSETTAAEMTELYWMAALRDVSFDKFDSDPMVKANPMVKKAADEINKEFSKVLGNPGDGSHLQTGVDVPGKLGTLDPITPQNIFRLGLPGEDVGPFVSQFFIRNIHYGAQSIDQRINPYTEKMDYLTKFEDWLYAQNSGTSKEDGNAYNKSNEAKSKYYQHHQVQPDKGKLVHRYISTPRDLARFVNKDALHQAYFNATLLLLSGGAKWTLGNPYSDIGRLRSREGGFGTLGGPHILALVSEVATRALKIIWYQKWQVNLRLRPEAYGGLVHVQNIGVNGKKRAYGLPHWVSDTEAAKCVREMNLKNNGGEDSLLLPLAFTAGSPAHPAYGAGHATVAGICITVLKAFFQTLNEDGNPLPLVCDCHPPMPDKICCLSENSNPYLPAVKFQPYKTGVGTDYSDNRTKTSGKGLTIEGELNKLAMNVAMGRSMGGVHWRTDNARSLTLGEAVAARVLADITKDLAEKPEFIFRTFSRKGNGEPKTVKIKQGKILVDGINAGKNPSAL